MKHYTQYTLGELVDTKVLQEILDKFSEATGLAAIVVDPYGQPLTKPSNFTDFCMYIRSQPEGLARCMACDDRGGRRAVSNQKPVIYRCHSGLTDLAAPIIVQNEYLGALLAGQVLISQEIADVHEDILARVESLNLDKQKVKEFLQVIEVVPEHRIKAAAELMYIMGNYIVEMGVANLTQKQLTAEMKAKADLANLLRATELKALQSQVNPHFLFNTLNTIARLAMLEGATQTQEIVYALSDLLRNCLRDIDELRTVEQEVNSIKDYLKIQHARFGDRISASIEIDPAVMPVAIPAISLQPLVENAIIHGIEPKCEGGQIRVTGYVEDERAVIVVADTGVGVSQDRIKALFRAGRRTVSNGQSTGLGITNVHKRIQHYFGNEYGLQIDSKLGEGTTVYLYLPLSYRQ